MSEAQPQYKKVIDFVRGEITSGRLKAGDRLPSEKELSEKFSLSRQTIRHATGELEKEKIITRVRGSGSFVGEAVARRKPKFMSIGVMLTYFDNYIFPPVVKGISDELARHGFSMRISFTDNNIEKEQAILKKVIDENNIDALIAEPSKSTLPNPNMGYYRTLEKRGIPVLFINSPYPELDIPCIRLDDARIGTQAVRYLIARGHRHIAGIFHCEDSQGARRYAGYVRGLREAGISLDPKKVIWLDTYGIDDIEPVAGYILKRIEGATAIFTYNDEVACQLIWSLNSRGIKVPDDFSIVSVDDAEIGRNVSPAITTFPHPKRELGTLAAKKILEMIERPMTDGNYLFMPEIIERGSVRDLRE